ncbi:MAG: response regulator [Deltaproteobacteria bacterium]|nr:response regulator [Deltaproteobacteria bacterium]MBW1812700.1 response regulator [Deltaproteobacteria bacterium]MBW1846646.1 response regulator [Deltaproteobacteria bacterium]MBW2180167.1 response regulator [Deltaproteobacteria bacterium]MBW2364671.1 response regulator [Deltaproteobacteria bacterium]
MELSFLKTQKKTVIDILIIEDDPEIPNLVKEILETTGNFPFNYTTASSLSTGFEMLAKGEFDIILLDLSLPDSRGLDTLHKSLSKAPGIPIILLTGMDDEALAIEALQAGAQDYIVKGHNELFFLARSIRYAIERKRIENELRMSEMRYRILFNSIDDAICVFGIDDNLMPSKHIEVNDVACKKLGYTREELLNLAINKILAPKHKSDLYLYYEKLLANKKHIFETKLLKKSGEKLSVEVSSLIFNLLERNFVLCVARDISERKLAEEERLKVEKLQGVIEMAGAVCHEVNQPLQIISGLADLLSLDTQESDPHYNEHNQIHREIKNEIQRMAEMNKKIMKITKYETKKYLDRKIIDIDKSSK